MTNAELFGFGINYFEKNAHKKILRNEQVPAEKAK